MITDSRACSRRDATSDAESRRSMGMEFGEAAAARWIGRVAVLGSKWWWNPFNESKLAESVWLIASKRVAINGDYLARGSPQPSAEWVAQAGAPPANRGSGTRRLIG